MVVRTAVLHAQGTTGLHLRRERSAGKGRCWEFGDGQATEIALLKTGFIPVCVIVIVLGGAEASERRMGLTGTIHWVLKASRLIETTSSCSSPSTPSPSTFSSTPTPIESSALIIRIPSSIRRVVHVDTVFQDVPLFQRLVETRHPAEA